MPPRRTWNLRINDRVLRLKPQERDLLFFLATNGGQVRSHEELMQHLYAHKPRAERKIIKVLICNIRKQLKLVEADQYLICVWGHGYRWNPPASVNLSN